MKEEGIMRENEGGDKRTTAVGEVESKHNTSTLVGIKWQLGRGFK